MMPLLADGERVAVVPARRYWPGDVVVFQAADGRLLVHRLLGFRRSAGALACVTQGDGAPVHDPPVPVSRLLGRVVEPERARASAPDRWRAVRAYLRLALRRLVSA
jgi:phage repressor protein C with HTH and peptisase S24 domain